MPPEYPEKTTVSFTLESGLPTVHSINGFALQQRGWENIGGNTYEKEGERINYDGVYWTYNGERVQFFENLNNKK